MFITSLILSEKKTDRQQTAEDQDGLFNCYYQMAHIDPDMRNPTNELSVHGYLKVGLNNQKNSYYHYGRDALSEPSANEHQVWCLLSHVHTVCEGLDGDYHLYTPTVYEP